MQYSLRSGQASDGATYIIGQTLPALHPGGVPVGLEALSHFTDNILAVVSGITDISWLRSDNRPASWLESARYGWQYGSPGTANTRGAAMWGRIDIRIELCEDQHVTILVMYDTGKQIHTVAQDRFNTRSPVDYTIDPSFAVN